jgi:hypothetical protein
MRDVSSKSQNALGADNRQKNQHYGGKSTDPDDGFDETIKSFFLNAGVHFAVLVIAHLLSPYALRFAIQY